MVTPDEVALKSHQRFCSHESRPKCLDRTKFALKNWSCESRVKSFGCTKNAQKWSQSGLLRGLLSLALSGYGCTKVVRNKMVA